MACASTRRDGSPCPVRVLVDGRHCFAHSPDLASRRAEARRRGGRSKSNHSRAQRALPERLSPVLEQLEAALTETHEGNLDAKTAAAMAALAGAIVRVWQSADLELRLRRLEEANSGHTRTAS